MNESKTPKRLSLRANFSWTLVGNVVNSGCLFGMIIVLAKLGAPEDVGLFALGLALTTPVFMFASMRLRDIQATDVKQEYVFGDYLALQLLTMGLACLVVGAIVLVSGYRGEIALVILAMAATKSVDSVSDAFYGLFMQRERLDRIAKSMMLKGPLSLLGLGLGFYLTASVFWGVVGLAVGRAVVLLTYDLFNLKLSLASSPSGLTPISEIGHSEDSILPNWNTFILARLAWLALPLGFATMLVSFKSNIPRYVIEQHLGTYQLGLFAAVASFQKVAPTVVTALGRSASPRLARYYAANNVRAFRRLMFQLIGIGTMLGFGGVLVALVAGPPILALLYGEEYVLHSLFVWLMLAAGVDYVATMLQHGMTAARYLRAQLPVCVASTGAAAIASLILIPTAGLHGAAIALLIAAAVRTGCSLIVMWHVISCLQRKLAGADAWELSLSTAEPAR